MRTTDEIQAQIAPLKNLSFDEHNMDDQNRAGRRAGFKTALKLTNDGKTSIEILEYTRQDEKTHNAYGNSYASTWQSGYICALYWAAEQYDLDQDGKLIRRGGNVSEE
ncbi:MAG: hypothetical protein ABI947_14435 [Chloroflexota bacterium]